MRLFYETNPLATSRNRMRVCNNLFYVWSVDMTPKFKLGDIVCTKKTEHQKQIVFVIKHILLTLDGVFYPHNDDTTMVKYHFDEKDLEQYIEKKKVKKYLWAYRMGNKPPVVSGYFHENESDFKDDPHGQITWCKRLDWSMIEVEE